MKQLLIAMVISFFLFSCAKQEILSKSQTEVLASKGGVVPNYLPGPCPYPCTDTRCQAYQNGYCGTGNTTISVKTNPANVYDNVGNQHNQGVASVLPTVNFSSSNLDSVVLVKVKAYVVTIGYSSDSMQTFYNKAVQLGYFPFSKIQELDSLGNKLTSNRLLSSYGNTYVQQMFGALTQYLNTDSITSANYNLFANKLISIETSIKNDTRISSYEKQVLLSGASVGRYSAAYWGNQFQGGSSAVVVSPMLFQKWKRWLRVVMSDIGGAIVGISGGPWGIIGGCIGGSIAADASIE